MSRLQLLLTHSRHWLEELDSTLRLLSWAEYKAPRSRRRWQSIR